MKKLLPNSNLDKIISEFQDEYRNIEGIDNRDQHKLSILNYSTIRLNDIIYKSLRLVKEKKFHTITLLIMSFGVISYVYYNNVQKKSTQQPIFDNRLQSNTIRSELDIPIKSARIDRLHLIAKINERFNGWSGIQTVALVGIEGAGKTTLARQYVASQELSNVWEINAESVEALNQSFENLAYALSETEEDQRY